MTEIAGTKNPSDDSTEERSVTSTDGPVHDGRPKRTAEKRL